jgi:hypothetical protein
MSSKGDQILAGILAVGFAFVFCLAVYIGLLSVAFGMLGK